MARFNRKRWKKLHAILYIYRRRRKRKAAQQEATGEGSLI